MFKPPVALRVTRRHEVTFRNQGDIIHFYISSTTVHVYSPLRSDHPVVYRSTANNLVCTPGAVRCTGNHVYQLLDGYRVDISYARS